ncbi:hypothetical protein [Naumannella cuiyingiana]|uniref:Uncharacterized protein n=1 Tax=Naumannella cuiyingiana TaxID=1347891 RepID=A0A7Z0D6T5_9ACTN|nr:hypothetical protein [Naumannella cuiyingiana]NYI69900.1 hypothetical protein [Naumannella cuiyingiana]
MAMADLITEANDLGDPRRGLRAIHALRRATDAWELAQVEAALAAGLSWAEIATELGVTKQAAHKRYAKRVHPDLTDPDKRRRGGSRPERPTR